MEGSRLEELLNNIYAKNSLPAILNGHSYSRSLRAHFLAQLAITLLLIKPTMLCQLDQDVLESFHLTSYLKYETSSINNFLDNFTLKIEHISQNSRTSKLWCQYWKQVELAKFFIIAERTGDFDLHLHAIGKMLPYFHAAGHLPLCKSCTDLFTTHDHP